MYTSNNLVSNATPTSTENNTTVLDSAFQVKSRRIKKRKPNSKRAISKYNSLCKCQTKSHKCNNIDCGSKKCKCRSTITPSTPNSQSLFGTTESYIMRLVKDKSN